MALWGFWIPLWTRKKIKRTDGQEKGNAIIQKHDISIDLPAIYQLADVFIYPSIYEGFGIPILEALQSCTPVITTNVSCMPETGGNAAYYIDTDDDEALAHAITTITTTASIKNKMVQNIYNSVLL